jgi:hypothetical protein
MSEKHILVKEFHMNRAVDGDVLCLNVCSAEVYLCDGNGGSKLYQTFSYSTVKGLTAEKRIQDVRRRTASIVDPLLSFFQIPAIYEEYKEKITSEFVKVK